MPLSISKRIETRANYALSHSPIFALRELRVESESNTLLISGRVNSFYHKQLAQEVVRAVAGKCRVVNSAQVADHLMGP
ncbi:MAG: transport-associated domain protein [Planctomycetaceae bacterium]|jgi:osmotically-inducible protein OsmY|nr:transport-associated domain protein [Planctomycetaceae bacterium]MBP60159.1 transport-associated domain protein [Planctomycetaceae bacterium]